MNNTGKFYRRPLAGQPIRYGTQPIGINKLKTMMKCICDRAGLVGTYSNHSSKRTCATQLYLSGIDEQEIMARMGHRSEKSVRKYKETGPEIQKKVASVLDPPRPTKRQKTKENGEENVDCDVKMEKVSVDERDVKSMKFDNDRKSLEDITNRPFFSNCNISFNL